jgi:uncharacterized protein (TIGR03435 family)
MEQFANFLSSQVERPVRNATGLSGDYDFRLTWALASAPTDEDGPFIFEAIQPQLGLRLVQKRVPVDMLVIDRIDKTPSPN